MTDDYKACYEFLSKLYPTVDGLSFYREIFPDNEDSGDFDGEYYVPNAIYLHENKENPKYKKRRIMLNDTWESDYETHVKGSSLAICGGLTYMGRANTLDNARTMNALIFDLDSVGFNELDNLLFRTTFKPGETRSLPVPTFIALSGSGLHLYYVLDYPIDLFPNIKLQMKALKYDLTYKIWDHTITSKSEAIQYQSINQGFRMIGSINSKYGSEVVAFRTGDRVSIDYLNAYAMDSKNKVDLMRPYKPTQHTLSQAKERFPEWYDRVVVHKQKSKWDIAGKVHGDDPYALYHWWLQYADKIVGGHRYYYMMCTAIYASKCDVPKSILKKDMNVVFEKLKKHEHTNELTKNDVKSALEAYDGGYNTFTIADIDRITGVRIERNKRNWQTQAEHLEEARAIRDVRMKRQNREWRDSNGRKSAEQKVVEWRKNNPLGRKVDCEKETGLSRPTVLKWWDSTWQPEEKVEAVEEKRVNHNSYWKNKQLLKLMKKK